MSNLPQRKSLRLKEYDYSQAGYYFVTICTHNRICILSDIVGGGFHAAPQVELSEIGKEIANTIDYINNNNSNVCIDKFVVMPNHIHIIVILQEPETGGHGNPPLHKVIGQFKSFTNKRYNDINQTKNKILWHRNYYDHVIRNDKEYQEIYEYIETNPLKWELDKYYQ